MSAPAERDGTLPGEHLAFETRQLPIEDGRVVLVAGLGEIAVRILGRAVERGAGVRRS